jgi:hypothetical protein
MGKKRRRQPSPAEQIEIICDEIDRRLEQVMAHNAAAFSESAARWYDAQYSALRSLRDWLTA